MSWLVPSLPRWSSSTNNNAQAGPSRDRGSITSPQARAAIIPDQAEEDEGSASDPDGDIDAPAAFPALDSAQRSGAPPLSISVDPPPSFDISPPSPTSSSSSRTASPPPRQRAKPLPSTLPPPTTTVVKPNPALKKRQKVALQPGCSALDWARLKGGPKGSSGELRGEEGQRGFPLRVTLEELKKHNKADDAWSAFNGRVYNITPYIPFHPGGEKELMRCAGRDGTKLFSGSIALEEAAPGTVTGAV